TSTSTTSCEGGWSTTTSGPTSCTSRRSAAGSGWPWRWPSPAAMAGWRDQPTPRPRVDHVAGADGPLRGPERRDPGPRRWAGQLCEGPPAGVPPPARHGPSGAAAPGTSGLGASMSERTTVTAYRLYYDRDRHHFREVVMGRLVGLAGGRDL